MNLVLTGFMGTGKSAVGMIIAKKLGWHFFDIDQIIEEEVGVKIPEIFAKKGEPYFREVETKAIKLISMLDESVISCGGGVVLKEENMDELEKNGVIVCLTASVAKIIERTKGVNRPLLNVKNPGEKIREMLKKREPFYKRCRLMIDTTEFSAEDIADQIIDSKLIGW
jgi:shikimate kinase